MFTEELNLIAFIKNKCFRYGTQNFIETLDGDCITYSEFYKLSAKTFHFLSPLNIKNDDKISILLPNIPEFLLLLTGVLAKGGIAVNLNIHFTPDETEFRLKDACIDCVITTPEFYQKISHVLSRLNIQKIILVTDEESHDPSILHYHLSSVRNSRLPVEFPLPDFGASKIGFLQYTGGTGGGIKAAMLSHGNILQNVSQIKMHLGDKLLEASEVIPATLPFYHVFGLTFNVFTFLNVGGTCVLFPFPRDLPRLIELMKENKITYLVAVNTMYKLLIQSNQLSKENFSNLKVSIGGGEHIQYTTKMDWETATGAPLYEAYGMTETCAMATFNPVNETNDPDTIGVALPETEIILFDENDKPVTEDGIPGEILLKGPQIISAYWNRPEENDTCFRDGWLRTGDIAQWVNGKYLKIIDRKKDMINVSGFKVYPNEVETIASTYPGILDCAVVGEKDDTTGEKVVLFYVSSTPIKEDMLLEHCRLYLTSYKVPKKLIRADKLPKSPIGKTIRHALRRILEPQHG